MPPHPCGAVIFAHGSGSSRFSVRNRYVASVLNKAGFATLLFDLLTPEEEANRATVFDIGLLANRLVDVTGWLARRPGTAGLPVGYFGAAPEPERLWPRLRTNGSRSQQWSREVVVPILRAPGLPT